MADTLTIYTHRSTGKDRNAAETVATVLMRAGLECKRCRIACIGPLLAQLVDDPGRSRRPSSSTIPAPFN
jgi:hypothetical protein